MEVKFKGTRIYKTDVDGRQFYTPMTIWLADVYYYERYAGNQVDVPSEREFTAVTLTNGDCFVFDVEYEEFSTVCDNFKDTMFELYKEEISKK